MGRRYIYLWRVGPGVVNRKVRRCSQRFRIFCWPVAVGLGASLTTAHRAHGEAIDRFLGLDPVKTPSIALIPIGWPKGRFGTPTRRSIDTCFFEDAVPEGVLS